MKNQHKWSRWILLFVAVVTSGRSAFCAEPIGRVADTPKYELQIRFGSFMTGKEKPQLRIPVDVEMPFFAQNSEVVTETRFHRETQVKILYVASGILRAPRNGKFKLEHHAMKWLSPQDNSTHSSTFDLELDKPQSRFVSGGIVRGYSVVLSRVVRGARIAAELSDGERIQYETPLWGKAIDGLELGVRPLNSQRSFRVGEVVYFTLMVRNNGNKAIRLRHYKPDWSIPPLVVDDDGSSLTLKEQVGLFGPPYNIPVGPVATLVEPGQTAEVAVARLTIGPARKDEINPWLDASSGRFKVSYNYRFYPDAVESKANSTEVWSGILTSGQVLIEVASVPK